jgi:hypothetical protein
MDSIKQAEMPTNDVLPELDNGVILLVADDMGKGTINEILDGNNSKSSSPSINRARLSSTGDSSMTSVSTPYSVPSFTNDDFLLDGFDLSPAKKVKHRRNRHVFASCCRKKSKSSPKTSEKSSRRRRRNRAWNEMDFETFMGFSIFKK